MHKIMIIEDDPSIRNELSLLLENEGYQAVPVTDFTQTMEQIQKSAQIGRASCRERVGLYV